MKNKLLLTCLIIVSFFINLCSYSQDSCPIADGSIPTREAEGRRDFFERTKKNDIWQKKLKVDADDFKYDKASLVSMLSNFSGNSTYDGMRIYFAVSGNTKQFGITENKLFLVIYPTKTTGDVGSDGDDFSNNDSSNIYYTSDDKVLPIVNTNTRKYIYSSITRYLNKSKRAEVFFKQEFNIQLEETHSLWFSKNVLFNRNLPTSLLNILNNTVCSFDSVGIDFAAWNINTNNQEFSFKTDILFELIKKGEKSNYLFSVNPAAENKLLELSDKYNNNLTDAGKKEIVNEIKALIQSNYADTAVPCPPAKCPSSKE